MSRDDVTERVIEMVAIERAHGGFARIDYLIPWRDRFALFRHNYGLKQVLVDAGLCSWTHGDPYQIADWASLFTPIERSLWWDIRANHVSLWPQLPVGRFFVDFGNPVAKIAVECDGRKWHDAEKDAARDAEMRRMGWSVYRIPGWLCHGIAPEYDPDMDEYELEERQRFINEQTPAPIVKRIGRILADCRHQ